MLKLPFAMKPLISLVMIFYFLFPLPWAQTTDRPQIVSPRAGDVLQGQVPIQGNTATIGFQSAELQFAFEGDSTATWYLIAQVSQPVQDSAIAVWDTTTIADGNYRLKLLVHRTDKFPLEDVVTHLRVRNYTAVETNAVETPQSPTSLAGSLATQTLIPTATALPQNPAQVNPQTLQGSLLRGALLSIIALIAIGLYVWQRAHARRR